MGGIFALIALVGVLAAQNAELKSELRRHNEQVATETITTGDRLPALRLINDRGEAISLEEHLRGTRGLLVFLTPTCTYCLQTLPQWDALYEASRAAGVSFLAISLHDATSTWEYVESQAIRFPVHVLEDPAQRAEIAIRGVPVSVLADPGSTIARVWNGALDESRARQIIDVLMPSETTKPTT